MAKATLQVSRLDTLSSLLLVVSGGLSLVALTAAIQGKMAEGACVTNLGRIGQATLMYCADNDDLFPTTFAFDGKQIMWHNKIEPYLKSGLSDEESKGLDIQTSMGGEVEPFLGWADSGGPSWHCPYDHVGGNVSYGANALIGGAETNLGGNWSHVRNEWWVRSLRSSEIEDPKRVLWAGDTNKLWQDDTQKFTAVFSDWARSDPRVSGGKATLVQTSDWFRKFLQEDHSFDRDECDPPGLYSCKGPSFRHGWQGKGTGAAGMVFVDGHAAVLRFGEIKVENIVPMMPSGQEGGKG